MRPIAKRRCVMMVAGEASGDHHGAMLVHAMRRMAPHVDFCGIGGSGMRAAGVRIFVEATALSVVGITEVFAKIPVLLRALNGMKRRMDRLKPDLLVLIDFPDFNLNLARYAKKRGIPVLYYISPQIWAWRSGRITTIGKRVDHVAVILPFEQRFYRAHGIPATFVGHPLIDAFAGYAKTPPPPEDDGFPTVGLLPGSRDKEVMRHLPVMLAAARLLLERFGPMRFVVSHAPSVCRRLIREILDAGATGAGITLSDAPVRELLGASRLVVAASGTVTLEAAITETPMVIIYRVSALSYRLGRALIRVPHIGLANLIAGKAVVPELIQNDATPEKIARTVGSLLADPVRLEGMRRQMRAVRSQLGEPGASERVAAIAGRMIAASGR